MFVPALFTRMSRRPHWSSVDLTSALTDVSSATSTGIASACPPSWRTAAADFDWLRPATTTRAPAAARPWAMPSPMPPLPPVTTATLPLRSNIGPSECILPEVVRRNVMAERGQAAHVVGAHRDDAVLTLRDSRHQQIGLGHQGDAMTREDRRRHDHVRDARLVLQGEEDEALRGARPLAN